MEEQEPLGTTRPPSWVILDRFIHRSSHDADARGDGTASEPCLTCTGRPIRASLRLAGAGFPAVSRLHLHWPGRPEFGGLPEPRVIAADGHSILFSTIVPLEDPMSCKDTFRFPFDLFVYSAVSSPLALHRLPPCFIGGVSTPDEDLDFKPYRRRQQRTMLESEIGLLCHGREEGGFMVVDFTELSRDDGVLCLLHHPALDDEGPEEWMIKKVQFPEGRPSAHYWISDAILPLHGRFLCLADNYQGILVVDVLGAIDKSSAGPLQLRFVSLPDEALQADRPYPDGDCPDSARCVCATADGTIKLVCVEGELTRRNFTIRSWTLHDINDQEGTWHRGDDMGDVEFWRLYSDEMSLPWVVKPKYPLVSLVDPDAVCFLLKDDRRCTYWIIEVDMRNKVLKSYARYMNEEEEQCPAKRVRRNVFDGHSFIPSEISAYLS